jgi:hypothetical protein
VGECNDEGVSVRKFEAQEILARWVLSEIRSPRSRNSFRGVPSKFTDANLQFGMLTPGELSELAEWCKLRRKPLFDNCSIPPLRGFYFLQEMDITRIGGLLDWSTTMTVRQRWQHNITETRHPGEEYWRTPTNESMDEDGLSWPLAVWISSREALALIDGTHRCMRLLKLADSGIDVPPIEILVPEMIRAGAACP